MSKHQGFMRVFAMPLLLGLLTAFGLLAALLWEPLGRFIAWVTLGLPIVTVGWAYRRKRLRSPSVSGRRCG